MTNKKYPFKNPEFIQININRCYDNSKFNTNIIIIRFNIIINRKVYYPEKGLTNLNIYLAILSVYNFIVLEFMPVNKASAFQFM